MRTFDASLPRGGFWAAVTVPPLAFLALVQVWANGIAGGEISVQSTLLLIGLAQSMPLGALAWTVFSTAAYSIGPGKLVVHRVVFDREFSFDNLVEPPRLQNGMIILRLPRTLRLRVKEPETFLTALQAAWPDQKEVRGWPKA